jgi:hypothetical protein
VLPKPRLQQKMLTEQRIAYSDSGFLHTQLPSLPAPLERSSKPSRELLLAL